VAEESCKTLYLSVANLPAADLRQRKIAQIIRGPVRIAQDPIPVRQTEVLRWECA
jgi:hypothetical protein